LIIKIFDFTSKSGKNELAEQVLDKEKPGRRISNKRTLAIIIFIIGAIIIGLLYYELDSKLKTIVNFFTLFGTYSTLFGLWLTYLQIQGIKETSSLTKIAVDLSFLRINQVLSVSDLSKATKIIQEIQASILNDKTELALIRMKDLKAILIQVKYNEELTEYTHNDTYNQQITDLGSDINNMTALILGNKSGLNYSKVIMNLESLATVLVEFENKIKSQRNDTR
jgi:hypothetical protein